VLVTDPFADVETTLARQVVLSVLLEQSDFVVCLAAATEETENLMDATAFGQIKPGAYFINAARGNLVDEVALAAALDSGRLAGAAVDVGRAPDQMPSPRLAARPDVIATPHIGGLTRQAAEHQAMETTRQVADILVGRLPAGAANAGSANRLRHR
jgi:D-3-phosphoglycerate dehydrogenase